ncbi:unnamed protein product [Cylindrotheca closterium]|uniref:Uncharacterized protein n=1 Tax=Cylindrotheca closterium TaxID=2856 RepID=A0AAD2CR51_9STRA|nr:unnamed protein product [Cylindrotheca closterium]
MRTVTILGRRSIQHGIRSWNRQQQQQQQSALLLPSSMLTSIQRVQSLPRKFSTDPQDDMSTTTAEKLQRFEDANPDRIRDIQVNPEGIGSQILPGNLVYKKYRFSGNTRKVPLELVHGYFWMMWDLRRTGHKTTLSNETLIPAEQAQLFPVLQGVQSLNDTKTDLPFFFVDDSPAAKKVTLLSIAFRDSGFKSIPSWTDPFQEAFDDNEKVGTLKLSITERLSLYPFRGPLTRVMKKNTPENEHDSTLVYFGTDVDDFRDVLRMHNIMTNYVFLIDDLGRIRFAGSGPATKDDVAKVIQFAKELAKEEEERSSRTAKRSKNKKR